MKLAKFRTILVLLLVALLLTLGLGVQAQDVELTVNWWGSQNRHDRTISVIELFDEANENIEVSYEFSSWGDYWTLMTTKAAGQNLPDVMQQDYAYMAEWQSRDLLMPLDDLVESGAIDVSNIATSVLDSGRIDGVLYGIPLGTNSQSILIDVDAFEAAGLELPSPDWTWAEFEETVNALHEELGVWGFGGTLDDEALWKSLYMGYGQWAFNDEGTALGYEDDQPLIDYFNMILRMMESGAIPTVAEWAEYADLGPEGNPLVTGEAVMSYWWSNQVVAIANAAGEDRNFRLWHLPRPEGGEPSNYIKPAMFFSITSQADDPEAGAQFIDFFTNSVEANQILAAERGVPVSAEVREALAPDVSPIVQETFNFLALVETDSSPIRPPDPPGWADILNNVYDPLFSDPVLYGEITVEEGVAILREEANAILAENE